MHKSSLILVLLFVAFIATPGIAWIAGVEGGGSALENKALGPPPKPTFDAVWGGTWGARFSDWVWDRLPLRDVMLRLDHRVDFNVLRDAPTPQVLLGRQARDFVFARERVYGPKAGSVKPAAVVKAFDRIKKAFGAAGVRVIIVVSPNKATLYEEELPRKYRQAHKVDTAPTLTAIRNYGAPVLDLYAPMFAEKKRLAKDSTIADPRLRTVFRATDQHWSLEAGRLQARAIVDAIDPTAWNDEMAPEIVGPYVDAESELSKIYLKTGLTEPYARMKLRVAVKEDKGARLINKFTNSDVRAKPLKIAVVRDSFLSGYVDKPEPAQDAGLQTIASFFKSATFLHWNMFVKKGSERHFKDADVVVIQVYDGNLYHVVRHVARFEQLAKSMRPAPPKKRAKAGVAPEGAAAASPKQIVPGP